jgi:replicative DNA helicase
MEQTVVNKESSSNKKYKEDFVRLGDFLKESGKHVIKEETKKCKITGISSGFKSLDDLTGGWQNSELILLAGRPAMGKTSLAVSMISNIACKHGIPAAFFSLESSKEHLTNRFCSVICGISRRKIKERNINEEEKRRFDDNIISLLEAPLYIDDTPGLSELELRDKAQKLVREYGVKIIIIDYLQLMNAKGVIVSSRQEEISYIVRSLKDLALELNIPIIVTCQLNRSVSRDGIEGKRPQLSDLRESDSLEQDSDMIVFAHRPDYYNIYIDANGNDLHDIVNVILAKNRNGITGYINLKVCWDYMKFKELP